MNWHEKFTERQLKEIEFARIYVKGFNHGTDGHNAKLIIAKMSDMLNDIHYALGPISGMGQFAEESKKEISQIMGYPVKIDDDLDSDTIEDTVAGIIINLDAN